MKIHTSNFKNEIKTLGKQQTVRITYTLNDEIKIIDSEDINSATPNYEGNLLKSVMKVLDLDSNIDIPKDTEIKFEYGLLVDGSYEYLNYGNYIVYSSEKQEDTLSYNIKCYDKLLYSMKDYEELDIVYPKTIKQYLIALCTKIGLEFKDSTFANQDRIVSSDLFKGLDYTYRDVLDQIAETTGGCICLTTDDKVEVRYTNKLVEYEEKNKIKESTFDSEINENLVVDKVYGSTSQETREESKSVLTGSEIVVNDTYIDNKTQFIIDGNSEQETTEGKNKFNLNYIEQSAAKVVTDTGVNLTNCWGTQVFNNEKVLKTFKPNTTYTMKAKAKVVSRPSTQGSHQSATFLLYREGSSPLGLVAVDLIKMKDKETIALNIEKEYVTTFTTPTDLSEVRLLAYSFYGNNDGSTTYVPSGKIDLTDIMLVEGTHTTETFPEYELYGVSPSPDYPQEIEVIDSANRFDINKYQGIDCVLNGSATVTDTEITIKASTGNVTYTTIGLENTGSTIAETYRKYCMKIPGGANKLIINFKNNNTARLASVYYNVLDEDYTVLNGILRIYNSTDEEGILQADINVNNAKYVLVRFDAAISGDVTYKNIALGNINKYLPYGNIGLEQSGKNIFDGEFELGIYNGATGAKYPNSNYIRCKNFIPVEELTNYKFSTDSNAFSVVYVYEYKGDFSYNLTSNKSVALTGYLTTNKDTKYITFRPASSLTDTTIKVQIEEGTIATAYEPYREKIIPIDLQGNTLAKVGDIKDILKVNRNGEVEIEKKVGKIVLDGNETWKLYKTYLYTIIDDCALSPTISTKVATLLSDKFTATSLNDISNNANYGIAYNAFGDREQQKGVCFNVNDYFNSVATLKTWLSNNNVEVYYELATPQTITLPSISPIELEQGTNIFKLISNLDTTIELTYNYISAMPSTETPSKINNTESINIKIQNESLFDIKELVKMSSSFSKVENGYTFKAHSDMFHIGVDLEMPISLPISISYNVKNGTGTNFRLKFWFDDGSTQVLTDYKSGTDTKEHAIVINNFTRRGATKITKIGFDWSTVGTFTITNFMISEGTTAKSYIKHKEQNISFSLDKPLYENCYLAEDGIHYNRTQNVVNITSAVKLSNGNVAGVYDPQNKTSKQNNLLICSKAKFERTYKTNTVYENPASVVFVGEETDTLDTLKQKFDGAILEYELKNEIIVPYTEKQKRSWKNLQKLISYTGKNYVESTTDIDIKFPINRDTVDEEYINDTNVNFGEKYGPINSIVLARAGEADKIYIKNQESIEENGLCELMISENQFMNFNDRSDYLQELSDELFGVEYYLNDFVSTGIMYYDLLDMYNIKIDDNKYKCLMLNDEQCITQGLEENIHTDMPEKSETDYTKADKTDRRINQTYLIVDKQNQQIEGIVNQIGDRTDKTTTITADIDGLTSKVSTIADLTNDINGTKSVSLEKCVAGEIVELHILGNNSVFKYQYLDDSLYLNDNLILGKDRSIIIITDENGNKTYNDLRIEEVLRQNGSVYDEYILKDGQAQIIRRINKDGTIKDNEEIEDLGEFHIPLSKGNNTLEIKDFSANIYVKWAVQNEYTDMFATKAEMNSNIKQTSQEINLSVDKKFENYSTTTEMNSSITQTAESINSEVRKKVGEDEIISKINQSAEAVSIDAQKININGAISANGNFQVDTDGNMICNNGQFNGGKVSLLDNPEDDDSRLEITSSGAETKIYSDGLYINNSSGSATLRIWIICR